MLFRALTGCLPFSGSAEQVIASKRSIDAPDPRRLAPALPADLASLCTRLLARDPAARPTGDAVLRALGAAPAIRRDDDAALGRDDELRALAHAFHAAHHGARTVRVHGPSGAGKSALVRRFLDELPGAVVLAGRSHARETLPFQTVDSLIDALTDHLRRLPRAEVEPLLPVDVAALARVFPVLGRIEAVARAPLANDGADPQVERRRAFAALRELVARLGAHRPLVLWLDDAHLCDADSAALLGELLAPPAAPPLLVIASHRRAPGPLDQALGSATEIAL
jgi:predicted ATPase